MWWLRCFKMGMSIQTCCTKIVDAIEAQTAQVKATNALLTQSNQLLTQIAQALGVGTPQKLQLQFQGEEVGMPGTETDIQTIPCTAIETDADNQPVQLNPANVQWSLSKVNDSDPDPATIVTLTQNADGSATFKALLPGTVNVLCTDTVANITGTDTLTVTTSQANKLVLQFGAAA